MKLLIGMLLLSGIVLAQNPQTPAYPGALSTDTSLTVLCNSAHTGLAVAIGPTDMSAVVYSGAKLCAPSYITFDAGTVRSEVVKVCSVSSNTLTFCAGGRGVHGAANSHSVGAPIDGFIDQNVLNQFAAEIKAIEATLGINLTSIPDPMNMTKITAVWPGCTVSGGAPMFDITTTGTGSAACAAPPSSDDGAGLQLMTGSSAGGAATLAYAYNSSGTANAPALGPVSAAATFRPFIIKGRLKLSSTSNLRAWIGLWDQLAWESTITNLVGIRIGATGTWSCVVYAGGTQNASTSMGVTTDTNVHTFSISATAAGTLTCSIDSSTVTASGTFPTSNPMTFGVSADNGATTSAGTVTVYDLRGQISGLNR